MNLKVKYLVRVPDWDVAEEKDIKEGNLVDFVVIKAKTHAVLMVNNGFITVPIDRVKTDRQIIV